MTKVFTIIFLFLFFQHGQGQVILNGGFEANFFSNCITGVSASEYNTKMQSINAWGTIQHHDAIKTPCTWTPYSGNTNGTIEFWTGLGGQSGYTILSFTVLGLLEGNEYELTFFDKAVILNPDYIQGVLNVGISSSPNSLQTLIGTTDPVDNVWTQRSINFTSPVTGTYYIWVLIQQPVQSNKVAWVHLDDFQISLVLPVELTQFQVAEKPNSTELHWRTASETNNDGFEVQRSSDGKQWSFLDFVSGHGTSIESFSYVYRDQQPLLGLSYYRLKQIDFDGAFEYSDMVSSKREYTEASFSIAPNPNIGKFTLLLQNQEALPTNILLIDKWGRVVWKLPEDSPHSETIFYIGSERNLPSGIYTLYLTIGNDVFFEKIAVH